jgi:hypothetical protein
MHAAPRAEKQQTICVRKAHIQKAQELVNGGNKRLIEDAERAEHARNKEREGERQSV